MNYPGEIAEQARQFNISDPIFIGPTPRPEGSPPDSVRAAKDRAAIAADVKPLTVVDKPQMPASGDRHDYMSVGPYWWPNPETAEGLPYIRRDGERNPEVNDTDRPKLSTLIESVESLALSYVLTRNEDHAAHARRLVRTWFLDPDTRMNPNLLFGQAIPGICEGRGIGLIETAGLARELLPAIGWLSGSSTWSDDDTSDLQKWFDAFLFWMLEHPYGVNEARTKNNHATAYDLQIATYALFLGKQDVAIAVLKGVPERRISPQIEPDGQQPHELARTKALGYSSGNLGLFLKLGLLGRQLGVDIASYQSPSGGSIRKALAWLIPFWTGEQDWEYDQIEAFQPERAVEGLRLAALLYNDESIAALESQVIGYDIDSRGIHRLNLLYPGRES